MRIKTVTLLIVIVTFSLAGLTRLQAGTKADTQPTKADRQTDNIKTINPKRRDFNRTRQWFGRVSGRQTVRIISRESGRIEKITTGAGQACKKGELLLRLGGVVLENRLQSLDKQIKTLTERRLLATQLVKFKEDALKHQFARRDDLNAAQDQLNRLELELDAARLKQHQLREAMFIKAPLSGILSRLTVAVGQNVNPGDELALMVAPEKLYIKATLFTRKPAADLLNKPATIALPDAASITATITRVLPSRTAAGARIVWVEGENLGAFLGLGQTVNGTVTLNTHKNVLALPEQAIIRDEKEQAYLFLATASGYQRQPVKTGLSTDGWIEIVSGIKAYDQIVTQGAYELFYQNFSKTYKVVD